MNNTFTDTDVLVIGGANIDIFGCPDDGGLLADSTPGRVWQAAGGVGRNIATNLARLGHVTRLISIVGNDFRGDWLMQQTRQAGVDVEAVQRHRELPTSSYLVLTDSQGDTRHAIADMRVMDEFSFSASAAELAMIEHSRLLVIDCNLPAEAIEAALRTAAEHKVPVFVDGVSATKVGRIKNKLARIFTLKVNRLECEALTAINSTDANWAGKAEAFLLQSGVRRVVISQGSAGFRYADARQKRQSSIEARHIENDTGAGDALMAGLVSAWLRNLDIDQQVQFGLACAAITLTSAEANHPQLSITRVNQWISRNS